MDFYEVIRKRRSFRGYFPGKQVPEDALGRIAEAVRLAPTACNRQPCRLLIIRREELRKKIAAAVPFAWLAEAPVLAVMAGNADEAWHRFEGNSAVDIDASIMMEHLVLAAAAEGLGTCWVCAFDRRKLDSILGLEAPWSSVALTPLGYARKDACRPLTRKELSDLIQVID